MDIISKINELKRKRNAVILAHNYQIPEVQDIADFTGDSLGLSIEASKTDADVIVFCGVYFMAETAKILSPYKTVLIPDRHAGCPMARMITVEQLRDLKAEHPNAKVMCYVNSTADVKAECDFCCTSANAIDMLNSAIADDEEVIFVPDKYLGSYAASQTGKKVIVWSGFCPTHVRMLAEHVMDKRALYPNAKVIVHPECSQGVINLADAALSTAGMLKYVKKSDAKEFIIGTEIGMIYPLKKENPDKEFYPLTDIAVCADMKRTTIEKVLFSLENMTDKVELPDEVIAQSQKSIQSMISIVQKDTKVLDTTGR